MGLGPVLAPDAILAHQLSAAQDAACVSEDVSVDFDCCFSGAGNVCCSCTSADICCVLPLCRQDKSTCFLYLCFPLVCGFVWSALCWWPSAPLTLRRFHVCWILVAEHTLTELSVTSCSSFLLASAFRFSLHLCQCWDLHTDMEVWVLFFSGL